MDHNFGVQSQVDIRFWVVLLAVSWTILVNFT